MYALPMKMQRVHTFVSRSDGSVLIRQILWTTNGSKEGISRDWRELLRSLTPSHAASPPWPAAACHMATLQDATGTTATGPEGEENQPPLKPPVVLAAARSTPSGAAAAPAAAPAPPAASCAASLAAVARAAAEAAAKATADAAAAVAAPTAAAVNLLKAKKRAP